MKFSAKEVLSVFILFDLTEKTHALRCQSPQYVKIGKEGILECSFPHQFKAIVWYDSLNNTEALVTKIERQETGNLKVSGNGYEGGSYDIFLNGSLIIPSVTIYHDRTFRVILIDNNIIVNATELVVTTIVHPSQIAPAVDLCESHDLCLVDSTETSVLNCTFDQARPAVALTWYGQIVKGNEIRKATATIIKDGKYTFTSTASIEISDESAAPLRVYTCEASGPALNFNTSRTIVLVSYLQEDIVDHESVIQVNASLNTNLEIPCTNLRRPTAFVWTFERFNQSSLLVLSVNKQTKVINNMNNTFNVSHDGSLNFSHVRNNLGGIFTCRFLTVQTSSINKVRVAVIEPEDDPKETESTFGGTTIVIILIVIIIAILGFLSGFTCYIRKQKSTNINIDAKEKQEEEIFSLNETENVEEENEQSTNIDKKENAQDEEKQIMYRDAIGAAISGVKFDHDDELVNSIHEIEKGDHIVVSSWLLHPRCHGIVADKKVEENKILAIRFIYSEGVKEEWMSWKPPMYKVVKYYLGDKSLNSGDIYSPDDVIARARSLKRNDKLKYSIRKNSCKSFARWCKTGIAPAGYDCYY